MLSRGLCSWMPAHLTRPPAPAPCISKPLPAAAPPTRLRRPQAIFDALAKTLPCRWDGDRIVVLDEVGMVVPPRLLWCWLAGSREGSVLGLACCVPAGPPPAACCAGAGNACLTSPSATPPTPSLADCCGAALRDMHLAARRRCGGAAGQESGEALRGWAAASGGRLGLAWLPDVIASCVQLSACSPPHFAAATIASPCDNKQGGPERPAPPPPPCCSWRLSASGCKPRDDGGAIKFGVSAGPVTNSCNWVTHERGASCAAARWSCSAGVPCAASSRRQHGAAAACCSVLAVAAASVRACE